ARGLRHGALRAHRRRHRRDARGAAPGPGAPARGREGPSHRRGRPGGRGMRTHLLTLVAALALTCVLGSVAHAGDLEDATTAYAQQKYERAVSANERAV